jgi:hypothetical protein
MINDLDVIGIHLRDQQGHVRVQTMVLGVAGDKVARGGHALLDGTSHLARQSREDQVAIQARRALFHRHVPDCRWHLG